MCPGAGADQCLAIALRWIARLVAVLAIAASWVTPPVVGAQDDPAAEARALFEEGIALSDRGAYEAAVERFRRSIALVERASTLFNLGAALRELRRDEQAIDALERFLELADASIDEAARAQATGWIASMRRAIEQRGGTLVLEYEPPGAVVHVDGMEVGSGSPLVLDLAPGEHLVEVEAQGRERASLEVSIAPGERLARRVELSERRAPDPGEPFRIAGWSAIAAGAAAFGGAIAASVARDEQISRYNSAACDPSTWGTRLDACPQLRAEIDVTTGLASAAWIGAAVLAGAGIALVLLAPGEGDHTPASLVCAPGFSEIGLGCAARF